MPATKLVPLLLTAFIACSDQALTSIRDPGLAGRAEPVGVDPVARGQYLVDAVTACSDCHTPRDQMGAPIAGQYLAGTECFIRLDNGSCLPAPNLTNHETGLSNRSDAEIRGMVENGVRLAATGDEPLFPAMPSYVYRNLTSEDLDAVVAYLRTVPGVEHALPRRGPEFDPGPDNTLATSGLPPSRRGGRRGALGPATPLEMTLIPMPMPDYAEQEAALRGRYLATQACMGCHTRHLDPDPQWLDYTKLFAGGEEFDVGLPTIAFAGNITSDIETGIGDWSVEDIVEVIREGTDKSGDGICPPMGVGPMGPFGGLTDQDAFDIGHYIKSLPPVAGERAEVCPFPPM